MSQARPNQRNQKPVKSSEMWAYPDGSLRPEKQQIQKNTAVNRNAQKNASGVRAANINGNVNRRPPQNQNQSQVRVNRTVQAQQINAQPKNGQNPRPNPAKNPNVRNNVNPPRSQSQPQVRRPQKKSGPMTVSQVRADRQKRRINPETSEIERKRRQREQFRVKKRRKDMFRLFLGRFVLFLIAFAIIGSGSAVVFAYNFLKTEDKVPSAVKYTIGENSPEKISYDTVVENGNVYINFSKVAEYLGFAVTGDPEVMNYIITDQTNEYSLETVQAREASSAYTVPESGDETAETDSDTADSGDGADTDEYDENDDDAVIAPTDSKGTGKEEILSFEIDSNRVWINKQELRLDVKNDLRGKDLWVDSEILNYIYGITFTVNDKNSEVSVIKNSIIGTDGNVYKTADKKTVYESISLKLKNAGALEKISEDLFSTPAVEFKADLSEYEKYMNPEDKDAYMILINYDHTLDETYIPTDLVNIKNTRYDGRDIQQMREYPAKALEAMFLEMNANNIWNVSVTSGYRSYAYQTALFNQKVSEYSSLGEEEAKIKAATIVAVPGTSEHQSGLCVDMHNISSADVSFANSGAYQWMSQNAHKFGFVVRFPEDKVDITKISFEPWHYRYVGRYHATRMYDLGMCLEEYIEYLNK